MFFFDTPELALNAAGVVVRARRRQGEEGDTVVKLRPVVPNDLPARASSLESASTSRSTRCRGDSCARRRSRASRTTRRSWRRPPGSRPIRKLFSKEQRAFYAAHAPDGIDLDSLSVLGPISILKLKLEPEGFGRRLVGELWMYPDGSADRRAVDQVPTQRGVPGRGGSQGVPALARGRPVGGAADEDQDGARVLLGRDAAGLGTERSKGMTIGPVQLIALGFDKPDFQGEMIEEFERLRESDTVRVIDALVVYKDAEGDVDDREGQPALEGRGGGVRRHGRRAHRPR